MKFERHMSDSEALMWNVEKDPWLNPSGATILVLEKPVDFAEFRHRLRWAVAQTPRMRERVAPSFGRLSPPTWVPDPEFDFDFHVRHIALPAPGSLSQLYDLASRLHEDPFDRTRPLWTFVVIDGVEGGRGALFLRLHHTLSDGLGLVKLSELYMDRKPDAALPPEVDIEALIAADLVAMGGAAAATDEALDAASAEDPSATGGGAKALISGLGGDLGSSVMGAASSSIGHLLRRQAGVARRLAGEMVLWSADPTRARESVTGIVDAARSTIGQLSPSSEGPSGSPLWTKRSRRRHLEAVRFPLADVKSAGKALGGSINDVFVTGAVNGALRYHAKRDVPVEALNVSFVISTRTDATSGANAFTPVRVRVSGEPMPGSARFDLIRSIIAAERAALRGGGTLNNIARIANLLPTSAVTRFARSQAANLDFATSNLPAAPFPMYIAGSKLLWSIALGPVAATAFNITALSYNGSFDMGIHLDPSAVDDPADLQACMVEAYEELLHAGGVAAVPSVRAARLPVARKRAPVAKKAVAKKSAPVAKKSVVKRPGPRTRRSA